MARKKRREQSEADLVSDLLELAEAHGLQDGAFDGDVEEECYSEARLAAGNINEGTLMGQLEFLRSRGFGKDRLAELIREYAAGPLGRNER